MKAIFSKLQPGQINKRMSQHSVASTNDSANLIKSNDENQRPSIYKPKEIKIEDHEHSNKMQNERKEDKEEVPNEVEKSQQVNELKNNDVQIKIDNDQNEDLVTDTPEYIEVSQYDMFDRRTDIMDNNVKIVIESVDDEVNNEKDNKVVFDKSNSVSDLTKKYNDIASSSSVNLRQALYS